MNERITSYGYPRDQISRTFSVGNMSMTGMKILVILFLVFVGACESDTHYESSSSEVSEGKLIMTFGCGIN